MVEEGGGQGLMVEEGEGGQEQGLDHGVRSQGLVYYSVRMWSALVPISPCL